jgi:hypothetical protein
LIYRIEEGDAVFLEERYGYLFPPCCWVTGSSEEDLTATAQSATVETSVSETMLDLVKTRDGGTQSGGVGEGGRGEHEIIILLLKLLLYRHSMHSHG